MRPLGLALAACLAVCLACPSLLLAHGVPPPWREDAGTRTTHVSLWGLHTHFGLYVTESRTWSNTYTSSHRNLSDTTVRIWQKVISHRADDTSLDHLGLTWNIPNMITPPRLVGYIEVEEQYTTFRCYSPTFWWQWLYLQVVSRNITRQDSYHVRSWYERP